MFIIIIKNWLISLKWWKHSEKLILSLKFEFWILIVLIRVLSNRILI